MAEVFNTISILFIRKSTKLLDLHKNSSRKLAGNTVITPRRHPAYSLQSPLLFVCRQLSTILPIYINKLADNCRQYKRQLSANKKYRV